MYELIHEEFFHCIDHVGTDQNIETFQLNIDRLILLLQIEIGGEKRSVGIDVESFVHQSGERIVRL